MLFAVGGTIKELMVLNCRYVAATLDLLAPFPAGRSGLDSGRSYLGSLVPRRQVRSGVALCQAGLVGRSVRWQCDASVESSFLHVEEQQLVGHRQVQLSGSSFLEAMRVGSVC